MGAYVLISEGGDEMSRTVKIGKGEDNLTVSDEEQWEGELRGGKLRLTMQNEYEHNVYSITVDREDVIEFVKEVMREFGGMEGRLW